MEFRYLLLFFFSLLALTCDSKRARIPNALVLCYSACALTLRVLAEGLPGLFSFVLTAGLLFLLFFPLFYFRMLGAGDIKFLMASGALLGTPAIWHYLAWLLLVSALFSLVHLLNENILRERFVYFFSYLQALLRGERTSYRLPGARPENLPLGLPLFVSAVLFIVRQSFFS